MTAVGRGIGTAVTVMALVLVAPAGAQENLDSGKSGAQLYAADCAVCHKNPQTLNKSGGLFGLSGFLREHYTASKESAAAIAAYLQTVGNAPAPGKRAAKRTPKDEDKAKLDEDKKGKAKSGEAKGDDKAKVDAEKKPKAKAGEDKAEKSQKTGKDEVKRVEPKGDSKVERKPELTPEKKAEKKTEKKSFEAKSDSKSDLKSGEAKPKDAKGKDGKDKDAKDKDAKVKDAKVDDVKATPPKEPKAKKKTGSAAAAKPDKPDKSE
jgi:hypothetical protein